MYSTRCICNKDSTIGGARMQHYLDQLVDDFFCKAVLSLIMTVFTLVDGFYGSMIWIFLGTFILDFITGVMKSMKKGIDFSSHRLRDSVFKLAAYMTLLTTLIITSKVEPSFTAIVTLAYYYYIFTESKSIMENAEELH
jgi:phage-related holin